MNENGRYFTMSVNGTEADIDIYGDICSEKWWPKESDMGAYKLSQKLAELEDVERINVNINSYGGEVAEGIAIYNALRRHKAKITTRCDGMACSIASVIFMAGEERIMYDTSMLMIHNASSYAYGTAEEMRKAADDTEKITTMSKAAYMASINISEEELTALMDAETWISPAEALEMGFATSLEGDVANANPTQSVRHSLMRIIMDAQDARAVNDDEVITEPVQANDDDNDDDDDDGEGDLEPSDPDEDDDGESDDDPDDQDDEDERKSEQAFRSFIFTALKR